MFAVLLWEIFEDGSKPFAGFTNEQAKSEALKITGIRLSAPWSMPYSIAVMMYASFSWEPEMRPPFGTILKNLEKGAFYHKS